MTIHREKIQWLIDRLNLNYLPVGLMLADKKPADAVSFKKKGKGCIASLIFSAAKGKTVAIDSESTGYPCSAFYLGYQNWIFQGIEYFLSSSPVPIGRECERFVHSPSLAKEYVESFVPEEHTKSAYVFKPLTLFTEDENPESVIFFASPDQLSALVFLIQYKHPLDFNRVVTGFASACMAMATIPLRYARKGESKAFWGLHDIAVRPSMPKDLMTISMPYKIFEEICSVADESFLTTGNWESILARNCTPNK